MKKRLVNNHFKYSILTYENFKREIKSFFLNEVLIKFFPVYFGVVVFEPPV